ncbi:hypothetical protein IV500_04305 [Paeniglutamicibacter antarcticus]|uniref:Uncharacterized protein n=1 Tax=Arthrobacter terrae TaxID=2935737 RepID=A0A931G4B9_9MICC|nr:hypothetical protein [Arthrobacter terrae]MBG0738643.1 hypothetical protein [Arthrobacter terrae]
MSIQTEDRQAATAPISSVLWSISDGEFENHFVASPSAAAVWLTDTVMRQHRRGQAPVAAVHLHDPFLGVLWDATADVTDVFTATGWPALTGDILVLRAHVIGILTDILVSNDTPHDVAEPGVPEPHTDTLI